MADLDLSVTRRQKAFLDTTADEVLYGGAAGGGKSHGQCIDALLYALKYAGSKQIIFRRTYQELEKSIIRTMLDIFPRGIYRYTSTNHTFKFINGSIIDCGYLARDDDVRQYQSAEYDMIRFDELTHFSEYQYTYMLTRLRGAKPFPRQVKSSTNPTGSGRVWVKRRFVDIGAPNEVHRFKTASGIRTRVFLPAKVHDNLFLMKNDPAYIDRLMEAPEGERRGLLDGEWDFFEGQYFDEFRREHHVCKPFTIPAEWRRYRAFDYGLDRLACLWIAVSSDRRAYVYREYCESNLTISDAARAMLEHTADGEKIYATLAPPDMWGRSQESGRSKADLFYEGGLTLTASSNNREAGWLSLKELMKLDANGEARLQIFDTCPELIRCLPELQRDHIRPTDCATEPHEITHAPDALRYFSVYWTSPAQKVDEAPRVRWSADMWEDYNNATPSEREFLIKKYGGRPI